MNTLLLSTLVLVGGTVHPISGPVIKDATVVIADGRIKAVGTDVEIPAGATRIDVRGQIVTPGFFDPWTQLGLVEISGVDHTNDADEGGNDAIRASHRITDSYNAASSLIPVQRAHGVTTVGVIPRGGIVSGQAAVYDLGHEVPVSRLAGFVASFGARGGGSRSATLARIRRVIREARYLNRQRRAYETNRMRQLREDVEDLDAIQPLASGAVPLLLQVNRRSDIRRALEFGQEMKIKLVLVGAAEAWLEAERLAEAGVGVILNPASNAPSNFDSIRSRADAAAILERAGVSVAMSTFSAHNVRKLRQWAGNAVRAGMSSAGALRAVTRTPAELLGIKDRGQIAPGMSADLVVWSGDPFEISTRVSHVIIRGVSADLDHRQKALFKRYRALPFSDQ